MIPLHFSDYSYSGRNTHKEVEELVRNSREVLVVSPYIDEYYARFLSNTGKKRICIIASSVKPDARKIIENGHFDAESVLAISIFATCTAISYSMNITVLLAFFAILSMLEARSFYLKLSGNRNIALKVPKKFVHAKMYIGEKKAIVGSANLTYAGMHRNIEHIDVTKDKGRIDSLRKQFWKLWDKN